MFMGVTDLIVKLEGGGGGGESFYWYLTVGLSIRNRKPTHPPKPPELI